MVDGQKVRVRSEHDLLQDDSEAVDVSFLSSVDRSSCHSQQFRCCPQLIAVIAILTFLCQPNRLIVSTTVINQYQSISRLVSKSTALKQEYEEKTMNNKHT